MKIHIGYTKMVQQPNGEYLQLFTADQALEFNLGEGEYLSSIFMDADGLELMRLPMQLDGTSYASSLLNLGGKDEETPV